MNATPGGRPIVVLVARREIRKRVSGRVFRFGTIAIIALIAIGIAITLVVARRNNAESGIRVGFAGATQSLERAFTATATASGRRSLSAMSPIRRRERRR